MEQNETGERGELGVAFERKRDGRMVDAIDGSSSDTLGLDLDQASVSGDNMGVNDPLSSLSSSSSPSSSSFSSSSSVFVTSGSKWLSALFSSFDTRDVALIERECAAPLTSTQDLECQDSAYSGQQETPAVLSNKLSRPSFLRGVSLHGTNETKRQTLLNMITQIRQFDPHPCVLGIPMMPVLFATSKFYLFIFFALVGLQVMVAAFRNM